MSDHLVASGDEEGEIKVGKDFVCASKLLMPSLYVCMCTQVWDIRTWKQVCKVKKNQDYISDMAVNSEENTLLATSGDGTLTVIDLRQRKLLERSDPNESELLCLAIVKVMQWNPLIQILEELF